MRPSSMNAYGARLAGSKKRMNEYTKSCATSSRGWPLKAASGVNRMPLRRRKVYVRPSALTSGIASATIGTTFAGRAR